MPAPDFGDVFFDFEGDPFWTAQNELMFLAGLYYRDARANGRSTRDGLTRWANSKR